MVTKLQATLLKLQWGRGFDTAETGVLRDD